MRRIVVSLMLLALAGCASVEQRNSPSVVSQAAAQLDLSPPVIVKAAGYRFANGGIAYVRLVDSRGRSLKIEGHGGPRGNLNDKHAAAHVLIVHWLFEHPCTTRDLTRVEDAYSEKKTADETWEQCVIRESTFMNSVSWSLMTCRHLKSEED